MKIRTIEVEIHEEPTLNRTTTRKKKKKIIKKKKPAPIFKNLDEITIVGGPKPLTRSQYRREPDFSNIIRPVPQNVKTPSTKSTIVTPVPPIERTSSPENTIVPPVPQIEKAPSPKSNIVEENFFKTYTPLSNSSSKITNISITPSSRVLRKRKPRSRKISTSSSTSEDNVTNYITENVCDYLADTPKYNGVFCLDHFLEVITKTSEDSAKATRTENCLKNVKQLLKAVNKNK